MPSTSTAATRLHTICVLRLYGHNHTAIGEMLDIDKQSVSRILNTPRGREMMLDMQNKQVELAIDPIQQKLAEYADHAADKLFELIDADAENVQRQAAKDILEMAGYTPKRTVKEDAKADTTIIVGQMNVNSEAESASIKESILEHAVGSARFTEAEDAQLIEEAINGQQHNGAVNGFQEQVSDEQEQVKRIEHGQHDADRGREGSSDGERIQSSDIAPEDGIRRKPGTRWLSGQGGISPNNV